MFRLTAVTNQLMEPEIRIFVWKQFINIPTTYSGLLNIVYRSTNARMARNTLVIAEILRAGTHLWPTWVLSSNNNNNNNNNNVSSNDD
jgi:hypothetical protein